MPYTRIIAAFMLATLISALFALPAQAAADDLDVSRRAPVPKVASERATYTYTVTVTNNDGPAATATDVAFTNTVTVGATVTRVRRRPQAPCARLQLAAVTCADRDTRRRRLRDRDGQRHRACGAPGTVTDTVSLTVDDPVTTTAAGSTVRRATTTVENADLVVTKTHTGDADARCDVHLHHHGEEQWPEHRRLA